MLTFGISSIVISILTVLAFVGVLVVTLQLIERKYNMDGEKWNNLLEYHNGKGVYYLLGGTYLFAIAIMSILSIVWFNMIGVENGILAVAIIMAVVSVLIISKFPRMKVMVHAKFKAELGRSVKGKRKR